MEIIYEFSHERKRDKPLSHQVSFEIMDIGLIEKILVGLTLFTGFIWLRRRQKKLNLEIEGPRFAFGFFFLLPAFLLLEAQIFPKLPVSQVEGIAVKILVLAATILAIGHYFVNPKKAGARASQEELSDRNQGPSKGQESSEPQA